ncbi:MAG: hypothetical protein M1821_002490 [Bathelium mastoideum]|nr:MAG: hypothetical protein M1821_002490 [Bathelium mastoideum]
MVRPLAIEDTGLKELYLPYAGVLRATIDIVAVHGIGAHPDDTWCKNVGTKEEPQHVNWLSNQEMLPAVAIRARILRFGYDSSWFGRDPIREKVPSIAQRLLFSLRRKRKDFPFRPLIFIAHCFGGLLVLKALLDAKGDKEWPGIYTSTKGLIFLGTPFRDAEGLSQGEMLVAALREYEADQVSGKILQVSQPDKKFLNELVEKFSELHLRANNTQLACFFELKASDVGTIFEKHDKTGFIVSESSGCLHVWRSTEKRLLSRTHSDMNKFGKPIEEDFMTVREVIDKMVKRAPELILGRSTRNEQFRIAFSSAKPALAKARTAFSFDGPSSPKTIVLNADERTVYLHSLRSHRTDPRYIFTKATYPRSCQWLLDNVKYQEWLNTARTQGHNGIFWIKGKPGTGKSTIMKFACLSSKKTMKDAIVISFFFNARGGELEKTVRGMYRSLLFQLLDKARELQHVFDQLGPIESGEDISPQWSAGRVKDLFEQAVENLGQRHLVCFIDALDECDQDGMQETVKFFQRLAQVAITSQIQFNVCFSGRHYTHIIVEKGIQLTLEDQEGHRQAIVDYLHGALRSSQSNMIQEIKEEIVHRSSGIFLWVVLVVKTLQKDCGDGKSPTLRKRLNEIPDGLFNLFQDILIRDDQQIDESILCLQWIFFAERPLRCEELYFGIMTALNGKVRTQTRAPWDPKNITERDMKQFILNSSKGLAEIESETRTVQFIHESVLDFLKTGSFKPPAGRSFAQGHEQLKQCCQTYLTVDFSNYLPLLDKPWDPNLDKLWDSDLDELWDSDLDELWDQDPNPAANFRRQANMRLPLLEYSNWININNLFEIHEGSRYMPKASLLYIFAEKDLPYLILTELRRVQYMDIPGQRYRFPLLAAVIHENEQATRALLSPMAGDRSIGNSPLGLRMSLESIILLFHDAHKSITYDSIFQENYDFTPLSWAAKHGHDAAVRLLLNTGKVDVNSKDPHGRTPLSWAACEGHEAVVRLLLDTSAIDVDSKDEQGCTPLFFAIEEAHGEIVRLLLNTGKVDFDSKDSLGWTPLSRAAREGHEAVVRLLLSTDRIDINSRDYDGRTPLWWAATLGHEAVVKLLIDTGLVDVDIRDEEGCTPLELAALWGHEAIVKLLTTGKVDVGISLDDRARGAERESGYALASAPGKITESSEPPFQETDIDFGPASDVDDTQSPFDETANEPLPTLSVEASSQASVETNWEELTGETLIGMLLSEKSCFQSLCEKALIQMGRSYFLRNMRRMLRSFYRNLSVEFKNNTERAIVRPLRSRQGRLRISHQLADHVEQERGESSKTAMADPRVIPHDKDWVEEWHERASREERLTPEMEHEAQDTDSECSTSASDEGSPGDQFFHIFELENFLQGTRSFQILLKNCMMMFLPMELRHVILSIPREHIWISSEQDLSATNMIKAWVEDNTQMKWNWWPMEPRKRALQDDETRIFWRCVSPDFPFTGAKSNHDRLVVRNNGKKYR